MTGKLQESLHFDSFNRLLKYLPEWADRRLLFETWSALPEAALASLRSVVPLWPKQGESHTQSFRIGSDELIQVLLPMTIENGRLIGYVEGISRISEKEIEARRRSIRHVALAASEVCDRGVDCDMIATLLFVT
ncbi:hypothetical protein [Rhodoferax sp.]|uniref:hypothetical protein n=1 Tax=Rhodoferax sp. TaxID=50421 RepID=UPI0025FB4FF4|nr:hypothetical protein [Rhodoferax sp.]MCM2295642.1 hypothetical protein [Rhodoferax sp.]